MPVNKINYLLMLTVLTELYWNVIVADQESIVDRIKWLINEKAAGSVSEFSRLTGIEKSTISRLLNGRRRPTHEHLQLMEESTRVRLDWLQNGSEPRLHAAEWVPQLTPRVSEGSQLEKFIRTHGITWTGLANAMGKSKMTTTQYQRTARFHADKKNEILAGLTSVLKRPVTAEEIFAQELISDSPVEAIIKPLPLATGEPDIMVRRISVAARASFGYEAFNNATILGDNIFLGIPKEKLWPGTKVSSLPDGGIKTDPEHVVIEVNGDSMEPQLQSGFEMLAFRVQDGTLPKIDSVVVVSFNNEVVVKRLVAIDLVDKNITLRSDNGGSEMRIPMSDIRCIYRIYDYYKARL